MRIRVLFLLPAASSLLVASALLLPGATPALAFRDRYTTSAFASDSIIDREADAQYYADEYYKERLREQHEEYEQKYRAETAIQSIRSIQSTKSALLPPAHLNDSDEDAYSDSDDLPPPPNYTPPDPVVLTLDPAAPLPTNLTLAQESAVSACLLNLRDKTIDFVKWALPSMCGGMVAAATTAGIAIVLSPIITPIGAAAIGGGISAVLAPAVVIGVTRFMKWVEQKVAELKERKRRREAGEVIDPMPRLTIGSGSDLGLIAVPVVDPTNKNAITAPALKGELTPVEEDVLYTCLTPLTQAAKWAFPKLCGGAATAAVAGGSMLLLTPVAGPVGAATIAGGLAAVVGPATISTVEMLQKWIISKLEELEARRTNRKSDALRAAREKKMLPLLGRRILRK